VAAWPAVCIVSSFFLFGVDEVSEKAVVGKRLLQVGSNLFPVGKAGAVGAGGGGGWQLGAGGGNGGQRGIAGDSVGERRAAGGSGSQRGAVGSSGEQWGGGHRTCGAQ